MSHSMISFSSDRTDTSFNNDTKFVNNSEQFECNCFIDNFNKVKKELESEVTNKTHFSECKCFIKRELISEGDSQFIKVAPNNYKILKSELDFEIKVLKSDSANDSNAHYFHLGNEIFWCDLCNKSLPDQEQLKIHCNMHLEERKFEKEAYLVGINSQRASIQTDLYNYETDLKNSTPKTIAPQTRDLIQKCYLKKHHLNHDIYSAHKKKPFNCTICGKDFSIKSDLNKHIDSLHKNIKHKCNFCQTWFSRVDGLRTHISIIHKNINHECLFCQKHFLVKCDLNNHLSVAHKNILSYKCPFCIKRFYCEDDLKRHVHSVHTKIKSHKCSYCQKDFFQKFSLKTHIDRVHKNIKSYKCHLCQQSFYWKCNLKTHIDSFHKNIKTHKCFICEKLFTRKDSLKRHIECVHKIFQINNTQSNSHNSKVYEEPSFNETGLNHQHISPEIRFRLQSLLKKS